MTVFYAVLAFVVAQRLAELVYARRNERRLVARGGVEIGARHYPLFIVLHAGWLIALAVTVPATQDPNWIWLAAFAVLQMARVWVIASLGPYWTTRVITVEGEPLMRRGPYRWVRHPNYWIVVGEIACLPLAFDALRIALAFSILNAALIWYRIQVEDGALQSRRQL